MPADVYEYGCVLVIPKWQGWARAAANKLEDAGYDPADELEATQSCRQIFEQRNSAIYGAKTIPNQLFVCKQYDHIRRIVISLGTQPLIDSEYNRAKHTYCTYKPSDDGLAKFDQFVT